MFCIRYERVKEQYAVSCQDDVDRDKIVKMKVGTWNSVEGKPLPPERKKSHEYSKLKLRKKYLNDLFVIRKDLSDLFNSDTNRYISSTNFRKARRKVEKKIKRKKK